MQDFVATLLFFLLIGFLIKTIFINFSEMFYSIKYRHTDSEYDPEQDIFMQSDDDFVDF